MTTWFFQRYQRKGTIGGGANRKVGGGGGDAARFVGRGSDVAIISTRIGQAKRKTQKKKNKKREIGGDV